MHARCVRLAAALVACLLTPGAGFRASAEPAERAPQKLAIPGKFIRLGFNDEGAVVLGYRVANSSVGQEWMLLETGMTLSRGVKPMTITRESLFLQTPDGSVVPLATREEFVKASGSLRALDQRARLFPDEIDYLPKTATNHCEMQLFPYLWGRRRTLPTVAFDQFELSPRSKCFGQIYFRLPDKIQYGPYVLNVRLRDTTLRVPFRVMTKEELKKFGSAPIPPEKAATNDD